MKYMDEDIREIETLPDGSGIFEIGPQIKEKIDTKFHDNLAIDELSETALKNLSNDLITAVNEDIEARKEWIDSIDRVKKYLGFSIEDTEELPFPMASGTFDTTMSTALIRFYATVRAELLPQSGPAGFRIKGQSSEELEDAGTKERDWLNYFLTVIDKGYYSDFEKFILQVGFNGSGFKKTYYDKILGRPVSRYITVKDFIIDGDCTSIMDSSRLTHVLRLSKRDIILNQEKGIYRKVDLAYLNSQENANSIENLLDDSTLKRDDIDLRVYTKRTLFEICEIHTYLNLNQYKDNNFDKDDDNLPLPYIVTIDYTTKEVLAVMRNWEETDPIKERINYFVQYDYLPGFGTYGLGLAHLIGANAITLTTLLRELVDSGKFQNLPAALCQEGMGQQNNDLIVGPGQVKPLNTGGIPLRDFIVQLPFGGPSQTLRELRLEIMEQTKELGSTSEMGMMESREDIPTGTALAFLETNNRIQSAVLRSMHYSLSQELQLIAKIFRDTADENFSKTFEGQTISYQDFRDEVEIIPISDPSSNSTVQRIMKAQATMELAMQAPELHNMIEVFKLSYKAQGLDEREIDKILKPDPDKMEQDILPLDPVSENINMLKGMPVKAAIWQEHAAHNLLHGLYAEANVENQELVANITAHIKEHDAYAYLNKMQQELGMALPPLEELENPEIQNAIAMALANALGESQMSNEQIAPPLDPNAVWLSDIKAKQRDTEARERIANSRAETEVFKAQLDFEKEKTKIESSEDMAKLRSETEVFKAQLDFEKEKTKIESSEDMAKLRSETELLKQQNANI